MGRTRVRQRWFVALLAGVGLLGVLSGPVAQAVGAGGSAPPKPARTYVVRPGDTLWAIATRLAPSTDPRLVVDAVAAANDLDPGALVPGQQLSIPSIG